MVSECNVNEPKNARPDSRNQILAAVFSMSASVSNWAPTSIYGPKWLQDYIGIKVLAIYYPIILNALPRMSVLCCKTDVISVNIKIL
ncbi:MAG: hypothetical protein CMQ26_05645 [Gammaproteobacteria bacterium]|nr:hypothetical protein [Gammaproteobacteria bacterium]